MLHIEFLLLRLKAFHLECSPADCPQYLDYDYTLYALACPISMIAQFQIWWMSRSQSPCLLLFHQEHFKQHIELFMVFRKFSQNLYNILLWLCDLRKRNGPNNPCLLTGHQTTLMPLVALYGLIGNFLHINTCYSWVHISTEMKNTLYRWMEQVWCLFL